MINKKQQKDGRNEFDREKYATMGNFKRNKILEITR